MTKKQVLAVLGEPSEVDEGGYINDTWTWQDKHGKSRVCFEERTYSYNRCRVYFTDGIFDRQSQIKPKWLVL